MCHSQMNMRFEQWIQKVFVSELERYTLFKIRR